MNDQTIHFGVAALAAVGIICTSLAIAGEMPSLAELQRQKRFQYDKGNGGDPMSPPVSNTRQIPEAGTVHTSAIIPRLEPEDVPESNGEPKIDLVSAEEQGAAAGDEENLAVAERFSTFDIHVDGVVYDNGSGAALINNRLYSTGQALSGEMAGVVVDSIEPDGVVLSFQGFLFTFPASRLVYGE